MSWKERLFALAVEAAEDAARERVERMFQGVNEVFGRIEDVTKVGEPQLSEPWPDWYADTVNQPAPPLDATARAIFAGREEERRRQADEKAQMMMRHMNAMNDTYKSMFRGG